MDRKEINTEEIIKKVENTFEYVQKIIKMLEKMLEKMLLKNSSDFITKIDVLDKATFQRIVSNMFQNGACKILALSGESLNNVIKDQPESPLSNIKDYANKNSIILVAINQNDEIDDTNTFTVYQCKKIDEIILTKLKTPIILKK